MKKYMMGLGAMLVGAGLMFVLMHGEVSADTSKEWNCSAPEKAPFQHTVLTTCERDGVKCTVLVSTKRRTGISCVKSGLF